MRIYRRSVRTIFLFCLPLLLIYCNGKKNSKFDSDNYIKFDTIRISKQFFLDNNKKNPSCNIDLFFVYPISSEIMDINALQTIFVNGFFGRISDTISPLNAVNQYVDDYIENYKNDAKKYKDYQRTFTTDAPSYVVGAEENSSDPDIFYDYNESLSDSIVYDKSGILSFCVKQSNNKGGVSSYYSYNNIVVDLEKGEILTESDIFKPGYENALRELIQLSLFEQNNVRSIKELEDIGYFGIEEILPNGNFLITDKGIIYTYNPGEYSALQLQSSVLFISFRDIKILLKENTVVQNLAEKL